jgi:lipopolysaccharide biosynthesis protein/glycosyltransferase involved in cell wall biosynthesis
MILTYHKVYPEAKTIWWVTPDSFYRQMSDLRSKKIVYLDDYDPADENQVVITFDGVYKDIWKYAVPILQHFGYPFELFIIGQTIGKDNSFDSVEPLTEFADVETLKKMVDAGGRLQWHSWSHVRLAGTTDQAVYEKELSVPDELRQLCPDGFKWYAYPHGERDEVYRSQVESRFVGALACDDGNNTDRYDLNRLTVYDDTRLSKTTVSLIIPCYNYGHLVAEAIESALLQTYPPDEILFIDDASSDNSVEVASRYEPRIRVEVNEKNLGVVENFRKAVALTSGDYIVFLGADNRFRSDYVEECKTILDSNSDVGIVYTHFALFGPRAAVEAAHTGGVAHPAAPEIYIRKFPEKPEFDIRERNYIHGSSMYRRTAYNQAGGYVKEYLPEDNSLFARMLDNNWKARLWDAPSLEYRHHSREQINHLKSYEMENVYLRREMSRFNIQSHSLSGQLAERNAQLAERDAELAERDAELAEIYSSRVWRLSMFLRSIRLRIVPPRRNRRVERDIASIRDSGLFDEKWYLENYPDIAKIGIDPVRHYLLYGGFEGRDPSINFSSRWYIATYADVERSKLNPLLHYIRNGRNEHRSPVPQSSHAAYEETMPSRASTSSFFGTTSSLSMLLKKHGGIKGATTKVSIIVRQDDVRVLFRRIIHAFRHLQPVFPHITDARLDPAHQFRIVPYYLNPYHTLPEKLPASPSIAIHLHLFYVDMMDTCAAYLKNVPIPFSLYISIPETANAEEITQYLRINLPLLNTISLKKTPNRGRDIAPFIIEFGRELLQYDVVAHIHTKKSPHNSHLENWFEEMMGMLFGSPAAVHQILQLLQNDAKFVYPAPSQKILIGESGWGENYTFAKRYAKKHFKEKIEQYPLVEFPQGTMFWATSAALQKFLRSPLKYTDFPAEPIPVDGTLAHALERLLLIAANKLPGRNYRLYTPDSNIKEPAYEEHHDYMREVAHPSVKVLSYYLPQFYPTPENDLWHGKGFTEWNKVISSNPLFYGHYQQRAPHDDIGYYSLTTTDTFKQQSLLMKQAGVYGQVFYHYWFSGKLILEKPTQMLLADSSIDIPFCFCWANENWTRKWDGNESEILLQQNYSAQDAEAFINYLIPFFKDKRYITIENRPILFVYRPSSIPDFPLYQRIWKETCAQHNLPEPYVVAILTRGAKSPHDFGMDAGCERVLNDWTNGAVKDITNTLQPYWDINGSVLDYDAVADHYMGQAAPTDFPYFRSLIPSWDNTPRYGSEAYIIHNSTPRKFQQWMEYLVQDAEKRLPADRRFILVNAWNEWAESAVLDPDKRFGYAYLNSIGRALSDVTYESREYLHQTISDGIYITITLDKPALESLQENEEQKRKMFTCLMHSTLFTVCRVVFSQPQVAEWFEQVTSKPGKVEQPDVKIQYTLHFSRVCYFAPDVLEAMLKMALRYDVGIVIPTTINDESFTHANFSTHWETNEPNTSSLPPLMLLKNGAKRSVKYCVDAGIFITSLELSALLPDTVSTIIRFHKSGSLDLLQNALYSLLAQGGCNVHPIIAAQDLTDEMITNLQTILYTIPFKRECAPKIKTYYADESCQDLRSLMLNQELKLVQTRYAAFLDYDDVLFPNAYPWLIGRLKKSGKNASFGLIYTTSFNFLERKIKYRTVVYDYGKSFADFLNYNHTPIHGFMLDTSKINIQDIEFFKCMKYMEDYYLTLQIFTEKETDWESLRQRQFIGDYYHYEDKTQTLASLIDNERSQAIKSTEYIACEEKINVLKQKLSENNSM